VLFPDLIDKLIIADIAPKPLYHSDIIHALELVDLSQLKSRSDADTALERIKDLGTRRFLLKASTASLK
jgi:hypothetical protein